VAFVFGSVAQIAPHAPQFLGSYAVEVSHPFDAFPSQSAEPRPHVIPQTPALHEGTAPPPETQA
jgi:hypothetical protein